MVHDEGLSQASQAVDPSCPSEIDQPSRQGSWSDTADAVTDVLEISIFEKPGADGPLAKIGQLGPDGKPDLDPSCCWMSSGTVRVASFTTMTAGAALIDGLSPQQAIGIGVPKAAVPTDGALEYRRQKAPQRHERT